MAQALYRMIERLDGEKGFRLIPYFMGQRVKVLILTYLIRG